MTTDVALEAVKAEILSMDPDGSRTAWTIRATLDQLYDGDRTGRYRWDQLMKTEKTHCGTLIEINMQREFGFKDGAEGTKTDYEIAGQQVDCKYAQRLASWMIPPEAHNELLLGLWASDEQSKWAMGLIRATNLVLRNEGDFGDKEKGNRDQKTQLTADGRKAVDWLFFDAPLPVNLLLHLDRAIVDHVLGATGKRKGAERVRRLMRSVQGQIISRTAIATVGQQKDPMKRVRANGGARSQLQPEGIAIFGHQEEHTSLARQFGLPTPQNGEVVSHRLARCGEDVGVPIDGEYWRLATSDDPTEPGPALPQTRNDDED